MPSGAPTMPPNPPISNPTRALRGCELEPRRTDASKHRELPDLFADRGGHADRDDEGAGQEGHHDPDPEADPGGSDLAVVSGPGAFCGLEQEWRFDST